MAPIVKEFTLEFLMIGFFHRRDVKIHQRKLIRSKDQYNPKWFTFFSKTPIKISEIEAL